MTHDSRLTTYSLSYWEQETFFKDIDTLIIGSGIVGLNAAIRLQALKPKHRIVILERGPLPIGASTRNAGFACFGSLSELLADAGHRSQDEVLALVEERYRGLSRLRELLGDTAIDYRPYGGFELFKADEEDRFMACMEAMETYNQALASITKRSDTYRLVDPKIQDFGFSGVQHLIHNQGEGQIHTGKMMATLLAKAKSVGVEIYNGIGITQLVENDGKVQLQTELGWMIESRSVIVATNGFATKLLPNLKLRPARNQVLITESIPGLSFKASFHYDQGYYYFRNIDNRVLLGGGRNLDPQGETTAEFGMTSNIQDSLMKLLQEVILPRRTVKIDRWWSGIMGVGDQKQPILERVSDRIVVAVRMGGMGIAIGSLVGERGAELLLR